MELTMTKERTTKRCVRYKEDVKDGQETRIGVLYVKKGAFPNIPDKIKVVVDEIK